MLLKLPALAMLAIPLARAQCAECHAKIVESYSHTAMARSFSRASPGPALADFYHASSDTHFAMLTRAGKYYQRRWQMGFDGKPANIEEKSVDFVMGSGDHVKTFLHRTALGELQQLPLAWYAESGGEWAMNPGYDKPDQPGARRTISYECMACHNAIPETPSGSDRFRARPIYTALPEGIDCQRCHGPGEDHVAKARSGAPVHEIRAAIVNPARLSPDRRMDVCAQCHLETTSFPFPHSILKYDRGPFSFRPGERLSDTFLIFDKPARDDRFQIVSSVYRLRQSACFLRSAGRLQCTTCHDPHAQSTAAEPYNAACRQCHSTLSSAHTPEPDCIACHMPKRRTDDVVHAVMTDHFIQRRPPPARQLLAERPEPQGEAILYHGEVVAYDSSLDRTPENQLYLALAQVRDENNLTIGAKQFAAALDKFRPARAEFYIELGEGLLKAGQTKQAIETLRLAVGRDSNSIPALLALGDALARSGDTANAIVNLANAVRFAPGNPECWLRLGEAQIKSNQPEAALKSLTQSLALDPDSAESYYDLAILQARDSGRAETNLRTAIRLQPAYAPAHLNLAILLFRENRADAARYHFESAIRYRADYALGHYNYALMLNSQGKFSAARREFEAALRSSSGLDRATRDTATKVLRELQQR